MLLPRAPRLLRSPGREIKKRSVSRKKHCAAFILQPYSPKKQKIFFSAAPPGGAFFCPEQTVSDRVIYQLYPTSRVYCAIDISVDKSLKSPESSTISLITLQQNHANFPIGYKNIAILGGFSDSLLQFLCNLLKYTCCTVFSLKFIHFGKDVKTAPNTSAIFVRFLRASLQFTSFFLWYLLLS